MPAWWRKWIAGSGREPGTDAVPVLDDVAALRRRLETSDEATLRLHARDARSFADALAVVAVVASRVLGLDMFPVQLQGAHSLVNGRIAEMQTGEGKTLAAVPAIVWLARGGEGVHVLTANDYLARRDAAWMRPVYEWFGLSVGVVQQTSSGPERAAAYRADITYATANEVGFDYLRDAIALSPAEQVHRPFAAVVVDEADSILIDEARVPLVIAGGAGSGAAWARRADTIVRGLAPGADYTVFARNVSLTPLGIERVEVACRIENLFDAANLPLITAVQDALHAHTLLARDVDYVLLNDAVVSVDEFKGRTVRERRWPAGLQTALECKEGVPLKLQGRVLGSITVQNLIGLYPQVCGMTGTAATQADEFLRVYGLHVDTIPTHRPVARIDRPDAVFRTLAEKEQAVIAEIRRLHDAGQPVLVGTASVEESERLSRRLGDVPHRVLNARNEEEEAAVVSRAGERGAVTISTNMAGRGVDIRLEPGVVELGGLHVIGTNRHESRRVDHQLRGRAGRQGDPGGSQFFVSCEDPLFQKYAPGEAPDTLDADHVQRVAEGQNLDIRLFLRKYETALEAQRQAFQQRRHDVLMAERPAAERAMLLTALDDLWSDYLAAVAELKAGVIWTSLGGGSTFSDFTLQIHAMFAELNAAIDAELAAPRAAGAAPAITERGATWTYLTTDEPFGTMTERAMRGLVSAARRTLRAASGRRPPPEAG